MDGTIVDLYGVENWLSMLRAENPLPYKMAKPLYDMEILNKLIEQLKNQGWRIIVISWLSKNSSKVYDTTVRKVKREWLARYNFPYDEIHLIKYGTPKANCTRRHGGYQILIDDNEQVRDEWHLGATIDAQKNIIEEIKKLFSL